MVRLAISVEGQTEEIFCQRTLSPYLSSLGIWSKAIPVNGRGGDVSIASAASDIRKLAQSFDKVTTLYDYYGFKGKLPHETKSNLEQRLVDAVTDHHRRNVIPYIQMYEFEGLLFSSPQIMELHLAGVNISQWAIEILRRSNGNPETINNSPQTAPSKRLASHTNYAKTTHGPNILEDIGLNNLRSLCQGFDDWIASLEALVP